MRKLRMGKGMNGRENEWENWRKGDHAPVRPFAHSFFKEFDRIDHADNRGVDGGLGLAGGGG